MGGWMGVLDEIRVSQPSLARVVAGTELGNNANKKYGLLYSMQLKD